MEKSKSDKLITDLLAAVQANLDQPGVQLELRSTEMTYVRDGQQIRLWKATNIAGGRCLVELKIVGIGTPMPDDEEEPEL